MRRQFTKHPVMGSSMTQEFMKYHDNAENYHSNKDGFNQMYTILDQYGSDDEDVDVVFDRATEEDKKRMLELIKPVTAASSQERGTVETFRNRRNPNKYIEVKKGNDGHSYARQYLKWDTPNGEVKNYMGARTSRGRYFRARRDSIDQMVEDYDPVNTTTNIEGESAVRSGYSFDFIHDGNYDEKAIREVIEDSFDRMALEFVGLDFESVDYSSYPDYADKCVSQCQVTFGWEGDYDSDAITDMIEQRLAQLGYEVIGNDFYSL